MNGFRDIFTNVIFLLLFWVYFAVLLKFHFLGKNLVKRVMVFYLYAKNYKIIKTVEWFKR